MLVASLFAFTLLGSPKEQELGFKTTDGAELHGTFVEPEHAAGTKLKAVLLLPGSGPTDRDGNQPPALVADTLKQISAALAAKGVASFRFDKRAAHVNSAIWPKDVSKFDDFFAFERFTDDAESALATLKAQPSVDPAHVGVLGHSEGALFAMYVAHKLGRDKLAGIAVLSGPGRTLDKIIRDQIDNLLHRQTGDANVIKTYMDNLDQAVASIRDQGKSPENLLPGLKALFGPGTTKLLHSEFTVEPVEQVKSYGGSVLLVQGEMDSQIYPDRDYPLLKRALEARSAGSTTALLVPNMSHNMKHVEARTDSGLDGSIVPEVLNAVGKWATEL